MAKQTIQKIHRADLRSLVTEVVQEVLNDPDFGLDLSETAKKRLRQVLKPKTGSRISLSEIKRRYY